MSREELRCLGLASCRHLESDAHAMLTVYAVAICVDTKLGHTDTVSVSIALSSNYSKSGSDNL